MYSSYQGNIPVGLLYGNVNFFQGILHFKLTDGNIQGSDLFHPLCHSWSGRAARTCSPNLGQQQLRESPGWRRPSQQEPFQSLPRAGWSPAQVGTKVLWAVLWVSLGLPRSQQCQLSPCSTAVWQSQDAVPCILQPTSRGHEAKRDALDGFRSLGSPSSQAVAPVAHARPDRLRAGQGGMDPAGDPASRLQSRTAAESSLPEVFPVCQ